MRHIPLDQLIKTIFADANDKKDEKRLFRAHKKLIPKTPEERRAYIRKNGTSKWTPIKNRLIGILGNKCWYTEVELVGAPLSIDHYRPSCDYWWLTFDAENYRVSCPYANSPEHNTMHGCPGGKGDKFPLFAPGIRATGKNKIRMEKPIILDPCKKGDCDLLAFQADGRPTINPVYAGDSFAVKRVEESMLLLNLDHPDFNSKREQLCRDIADDVMTHEELPVGASGRNTIRTRIGQRIMPNEPFSTAARYYLRLHRHLEWVEQLLAAAD